MKCCLMDMGVPERYEMETDTITDVVDFVLILFALFDERSKSPGS